MAGSRVLRLRRRGAADRGHPEADLLQVESGGEDDRPQRALPVELGHVDGDPPADAGADDDVLPRVGRQELEQEIIRIRREREERGQMKRLEVDVEEQ